MYTLDTRKPNTIEEKSKIVEKEKRLFIYKKKKKHVQWYKGYP